MHMAFPWPHLSQPQGNKVCPYGRWAEALTAFMKVLLVMSGQTGFKLGLEPEYISLSFFFPSLNVWQVKYCNVMREMVLVIFPNWLSWERFVRFLFYQDRTINSRPRLCFPILFSLDFVFHHGWNNPVIFDNFGKNILR